MGTSTYNKCMEQGIKNGERNLLFVYKKILETYDHAIKILFYVYEFKIYIVYFLQAC